MSTPEIESATVNGADLSTLSTEELIRQVAQLRQENSTLRRAKDKVGLAFKRVPEDGNEAIQKMQDSQFPYLTRVPELSVDKKDSLDGNIALIEGENLAALAALQMTHKGRVDVIYIDPPYNTGNDDFIYDDKRIYKSTDSDIDTLEPLVNGKSRSVHRDDPFRHSKWLSFMERRLFLARELMKDTGSIIVAIGDEEHHRLRLLMDQIFGEDNFLSNVVWQGGVKGNARFSGGGIDYMLIYTKNKNAMVEADMQFRMPRLGLSDVVAKGAEFWESTDNDAVAASRKLSSWVRSQGDALDKSIREHLKIDWDGTVIKADNMSAPSGNGARYDLLHPTTGKPVPVPPGGWRWSISTMKDRVESGGVWFGLDETAAPRSRKPLLDLDSYVPKPLIESERARGSNHLKKIIGNGSFSFPKDHEILSNWFGAVASKNAIFVDFFAGSGTTGEAVVKLNKEDGGTRSCILITNNEANIAHDVTQKRLERVLTGKNWADGKAHEALPGSLSYFTLDFMDIPSNPMSRAQKLECSFEGLAMLEQNALNVVDADPDGDYAVYRNSSKVVVVWKDFHSVLDGDCEDLLHTLRSAMDVKDFVVYVPSETEESDLSVDGWNVIAVPHLHIERYQSMIDRMRQNQTLPSSS